MTTTIPEEEAFKDGQKKPTPPPADSTRVFYESLFEQKGTTSLMATQWCVDHGVLEGEALQRALKAVKKASGA